MGRPRKDERAIGIANVIEEALWKLLEGCPTEKLRVNAIANEAHVNRGTFYYYYNDLDELLEDIVNDCLDETAFQRILAQPFATLQNEGVACIAKDDESLVKLKKLIGRSTTDEATTLIHECIIDGFVASLGAANLDVLPVEESQRCIVLAGGIVALLDRESQQVACA